MNMSSVNQKETYLHGSALSLGTVDAGASTGLLWAALTPALGLCTVAPVASAGQLLAALAPVLGLFIATFVPARGGKSSMNLAVRLVAEKGPIVPNSRFSCCCDVID
jgi:hypothetical protein